MKKVMYQTGMATITAIIALFGQFIIIGKSTGVYSLMPIVEAIPGMLMLLGMVIIGLICKKYLPFRIPAIAYVVLFGCFLTIPGFIPGS